MCFGEYELKFCSKFCSVLKVLDLRSCRQQSCRQQDAIEYVGKTKYSFAKESFISVR